MVSKYKLNEKCTKFNNKLLTNLNSYNVRKSLQVSTSLKPLHLELTKASWTGGHFLNGYT